MLYKKNTFENGKFVKQNANYQMIYLTYNFSYLSINNSYHEQIEK